MIYKPKSHWKSIGLRLLNHLATLKYLSIKYLGRITRRCLGSGYKHLIYKQKVASSLHCPSKAISHLPWALFQQQLCLSSCSHSEMLRIIPDLHPSQLCCTQWHWHLFHVFAKVSISVSPLCGHSRHLSHMKEPALLVLRSNLLSPQYTWCSLYNSNKHPAWKRTVLFVIQGTLLMTRFPTYFLSLSIIF